MKYFFSCIVNGNKCVFQSLQRRHGDRKERKGTLFKCLVYLALEH